VVAHAVQVTGQGLRGVMRGLFQGEDRHRIRVVLEGVRLDRLEERGLAHAGAGSEGVHFGEATPVGVPLQRRPGPLQGRELDRGAGLRLDVGDR